MMLERKSLPHLPLLSVCKEREKKKERIREKESVRACEREARPPSLSQLTAHSVSLCVFYFYSAPWPWGLIDTCVVLSNIHRKKLCFNPPATAHDRASPSLPAERLGMISAFPSAEYELRNPLADDAS